MGPLRASEVAARADLGDVTQRSLAWCEGQADWLPIADIAELAAIVPAAAIAPPSAPAIEPSAAPVPGASARTDSTAAPMFAFAPDAFPGTEWTPPEKYVSSVPLLLGIFGVVVVVTGIALYLGNSSSTGSTTDRGISAGATPPRAENSAQSPAGSDALSNTAIEDVGDDTYLAELAGVADAGTRVRPTERLRDDGRPLPMPIAGGSTTGATTQAPSGDSFETHVTTSPRPAATGPLDAAQISAVVRSNRSRAQRCYERAATMSGSAPDVRLSVTLRIATSGAVSNVDIDGNDFGGVIECVRRIVSTWQFPASTTGGQTTFSLVFAGG